MLVPVLRGRAAVTLGHETSSLGPDGSVTALVAPAQLGALPRCPALDVAVVSFAVLS